MKREVKPANSTRLPSQSRRRVRPAEARVGASGLEELSLASSEYARQTPVPRRRGTRFNIVLAALVSLALGTVVGLVGTLEYRCDAVLKLSGKDAAASMETYRAELRECAWRRLGQPALDTDEGLRWLVDAPEPLSLRLSLIVTDQSAGTARLRQVAERYVQHMGRLAAEARGTPSMGERALQQRADSLQARLTKAQQQVENALQELPQADPKASRAPMMAEWHELRTGFADVRGALAHASAQVAELKRLPDPTHGIVSTERRAAAMEADIALQQDRKELVVKLADVKLRLLHVWNEAATPLERLNTAAKGLTDMVTDDALRVLPDTERDTLKAVSKQAQRYLEALSAFTPAWSQGFERVRAMEPDPTSDDLLDAHRELRSQLSDFFYEASKHLSSLRSSVEAIGEGAADTARFHVTQSNLVRRFRAVQSEHHRFEFAAGGIEPRDNFRLDASLKGARGLRRRAKHRSRSIEERLQAEAAQEARVQRQQDLQDAKTLIEQLQVSADDTVDKMLNLQERLNINSDLTEAFLQKVLQAAVAESQLETTRQNLSETKDQLQAMAVKRVAEAADVKVRLASCASMGTPVDMGKRIRRGVLCAVLTLIAVGVVQWWATRRA